MRFATTFCDLQRRRVFDVAAGRSKVSLADYLNQMKGKDRVRIICMDLSVTYRSIARTHFPKALVVADRFHVVRIALHHLLKTCRFIDTELKDRRGLSKLLNKHASNLTQRQARRLADYLDSKPAIERILSFQGKPDGRVDRQETNPKGQCRTLVRRLLEAIDQLRLSGFNDCQKLAKTLQSWQEEIARMWPFSRSNGITEGYHRKMKLIQRRAFGSRNFENYRKRVRALWRLKVKEGET